MTRKIVAIHGIGNNKPGWSDSLRAFLDIPESDWIEFNYEDLMDKTWFHRVVVTATKVYLSHTYGPEAAALGAGTEDYFNDLVSYFVMNGTRLEIAVRLKEILRAHPDAIILAHSLGSVVAYETLKNFDLSAHTLITMGSPLSKHLVKRFLRVQNRERPKLVNWYNVWSLFDPVSGKVEGLGCHRTDQFHIRNTHFLLGYVASQKARIQALYDPGASPPSTPSEMPLGEDSDSL
jgi:pimeloyl-ACP methyl ester carboxylesterase